MANESKSSDPGKTDADWVQVGSAPPPESLADAPAEVEERPFEARQARPPWKYSVYTGVAGLALMALLVVFPDLRFIETPWDRSFPTVFPVLVFPVFAFIWGVIGALGKPYRADASRAVSGIVLAVVTFGLGYLVVNGSREVESPAPEAADPRLQMTPQELKQWRSDKLNR